MNKLPEKWAILQSISKEVCEWFRNKNFTTTACIDGSYKYLAYNSTTDKSTYWAKLPEDFKEITFEQFKEHVLKEKIMEKRFVEVIESRNHYPTHPKAKEYGCTNYHHWKHLPGPENGQILETVKEVLVNDSEKAYILKDVDDIEYIISIKGVKLIENEIMKKKIIGYKLKDEKYIPALVGLCPHWMPNVHKTNGYDVLNGSGAKDTFKDAGVLDLWFEPVYEEDEFKVGDWVYVQDTEGSNELSLNPSGDIVQISEFGDNNVALTRNGKYCLYASKNYLKRKATPEEIAKAQEIVLLFGKVKCVINKFKGVVNCEGYGDIKISKIVSLYEELNKFTKGGNFFGYSLELPTIKFGCVKGTFDELEGIYNEIKKS